MPITNYLIQTLFPPFTQKYIKYTCHCSNKSPSTLRMAQPKYSHYKYVYLKSGENKGISHLRHILNEKCEPLMHNELKQKYHINITSANNNDTQMYTKTVVMQTQKF